MRTTQEINSGLEPYLAERIGQAGYPTYALQLKLLGLPSEQPVTEAPGGGTVWAGVSDGLVLVTAAHPGQQVCGVCVERRWLAQRTQVETRALKGAKEYLSRSNPWFTGFSLEALGDIVERALATRHEGSNGTVFAFYLRTLRVAVHEFVPDSGCPLCAPVVLDSAEGAAISLRSRRKPAADVYRLAAAADVDLPLKAYLNPVVGLLGHGRYTEPEHHFNAKAYGYFQDPDTYHDPVSWGGHTNCLKSSLNVGLLEGLERHSGLRPRSKKTVVHDTLRNLAGDALDPARCGLYEPLCYQWDPRLTPFTEDLKIHWVWGYSLTSQRPILVPSQMVYYGNEFPAEPHFVQDNSNGCATGSCLEEAILHGLLELIERDAFVLTWYGGLSPRRIDPATSRNKSTLYLLDRAERLNLEVHILDTRLDLGVPSVIGMIRRRDRSQLGAMSVAAGAGLNPEDAIRSAMGEITSYVVGSDERVAKDEGRLREMAANYEKVRGLRDHALLYGLPEMAEQTDFLTANPAMLSVADTYAGWEREYQGTSDLRDDIDYCVARLKAAGLDEVIVVDQTSPEQRRVGLNTVSVIVPGLAPIDFGYHCRRVVSLPRIYTAPRQAGYVNRDLRFDDLNPLPHMFP